MKVGDKLPELHVTMTAQKIISAAAATRDWQPIHHDHEAAIKAGLRGVILNSPSQAGWISRFITDCTGPRGLIRKMSFRMRDSICPGDELTIRGEITHKENSGDELLLHADVQLAAGDQLKTTATVVFSVPT